MKYGSIVLVKSDNIYHFKDLIPNDNNYMYLKILNNGKIFFAKGKFIKSMFGLRKLEKYHIDDVKHEFFKEYLYILLNKVRKENSAYQFNFQYKSDIILYSCSIYPCLINEKCKSFDIIIRQNNVNTNDINDLFAEL